MTFLSAVSTLTILTSGYYAGQDGLTKPLSQSLAKAAQARVITFSQGTAILGQGVFISPVGYALAPGEVAFDSEGNPRRSLRAAFGKEREVPVKIESFDSVTDMALVRIPYSAEDTAPSAVPANKVNSAVVLVALPNGAVRGHIAQSGVPGVMGLSHRYMPLNEIRLESEQGVTGAPVFLPDGRLVGMLLAALTPDANADSGARSGAGGGGGPSMVKELAPATTAAKNIGPTASATAFAIDAAVLYRVIDGFLSPGHQVSHPWIGLFFKSSVGGGALVTEVTLGSPAQQGGIGIGDIINGVAGQPVSTHVELAARLFTLQVGSAVEFNVVRGGLARKVYVKVGTESGANMKLQRVASGGKGF